MKAKVKATGTIVNVFFDKKTSLKCNAPVWGIFFEEKNDNGVIESRMSSLHERELEFIEDNKLCIDWEKRRYEIAKEAMTAIMSNNDFYEQVLYESAEKGNRQIQVSISVAAVVFADALIEELKKNV